MHHSTAAQRDIEEPNTDKDYTDMEVYGDGNPKSFQSFYDGSNRVLLTGGPPREIWMSVGIIGALLYAMMQGFLDVGLKVGYEKVSL